MSHAKNSRRVVNKLYICLTLILLTSRSPSTAFMAPGLVLERHRRDTRTRRRPQRHTHCHYEGHIRGAEDESRVALSACNGIVSMALLVVVVTAAVVSLLTSSYALSRQHCFIGTDT